MIDTLSSLLWVTLGAAIGGPARFFLSGFVGRRIGETFPWGTFAVNVSGAFIIGAFAAFALSLGLTSTSAAWLFFVTGVLGSFTTVSSFSLQTLALASDGEGPSAFANAGLSLGLCVISAAAGFSLASMMAR